MSTQVTVIDLEIPAVVPTTAHFKHTLIQYKDFYDPKKIGIAVKLNTWDNPNKGYRRVKEKLTLKQKAEIIALKASDLFLFTEKDLADRFKVSRYMIRKVLKEADES